MEPRVDFIVRRPIYDTGLSTIGYDLLFESAAGENSAARLIVEGASGFELPDLLRDAPGFVSVTEDLIASPQLAPLPGLGFDLSPSVTISEQVAVGIRNCVSLGIPVGVHDVHRPEVEAHALAGSVTWSRLDAGDTPAESLRAGVAAWQRIGVPVLVDGIASRVQHQIVRRMGVNWFSGAFATEPVARTPRMSPSRLGVLRLLMALYAPDSSLADIATLVENEPAISYRLLRLLNSAHYGLNRAVSSVKEAVILLGPQQISSWVSLIAMSGIEDVPSEAMTTAVVRGRMAEQLARDAGETVTSSYFLVGVLSTLDRIMHAPLDDLIEGLPLDESIVAALLQREGQLGAALTVVIAYEEARWADVRKFRWPVDSVRLAYLDAVSWAGSVGSQLAA